jgi:hypothetical protein
MPPEPFPETDRTWIVEHLDKGADEAIRSHLMSVYSEPLQKVARERFRLPADAAMDIVHGFFAHRVAQPEYLREWDQREIPLRNWLWKGLWFHAHEDWRRDRRMPNVPQIPDVADPSQIDPAELLDRAFVTSIVREAMQRTRAACEGDGFGEHWRVFRRRYVEGERLVDIARDEQLSPDRALVMLRAPRRRFQNTIAELLIADGTPADEVPRVLRELQELLP